MCIITEKLKTLWQKSSAALGSRCIFRLERVAASNFGKLCAYMTYLELSAMKRSERQIVISGEVKIKLIITVCLRVENMGNGNIATFLY